MKKIDKNYKIKVNPEQSKQIQEICFNYGIKWDDNKDELANIDSPYIYIYPSENITRYGNGIYFFMNHRNTEISAEDFISTYANKEQNNSIDETENNKQPFIIIRSTGEEGFSQKLNNIYERYPNIEVDYKPILSHSGNIIYTALVKVLDNSGELGNTQKLNIG